MKSYEPNIKIKNLKNEPINGIYIGRKNSYYGLEESKWHNPIKLEKESDRGKVYDEYINYIKLNNDELYNSLEELDNNNLFCYCSPKLCHAEALVELLSDKINNINYILHIFSEFSEFFSVKYQYYNSKNYYFDITKTNNNIHFNYDCLVTISTTYGFTILTKQGFRNFILIVNIENPIFNQNNRQLKLNDMFTLM